MSARTFVDRGGTFTDIVTVDEHGIHASKVPSDTAVVGDLARGDLVFGTTVATNALLERRVAPVLLVVTRGFADLAFIGDMTRPSLFEPDEGWPAPLVARVAEVEGRHGPDGAEVDALRFDTLDLTGVQAVAVVLFGSGWNPAHELAIAATLPAGLPVSLGHLVAPEVGYLTRIEATLLDAAVSPVLQEALERDRIPAAALAIRSDGGLVPARELRAPDAVLSGPAGGVLAVVEVAKIAGVDLAIGLDMGGTSTDVCLIESGVLPRREPGWRVNGFRVGRAALEVETIAAGGGSILGHDGVGWTVGPASAGAFPGPQAWGQGGPATLTDAAIAAGLVDTGMFPRPLFPERVDLPGPAAGFLAVAREAMAAAVRRLGLRRGIDVRKGALVAFGGAAGQHACAVADRLGVDTVLVHVCGPVLSAWGQAFAMRSEERTAAVWALLPGAWAQVERTWLRLEADLPRWGPARREVDLRLSGTDAAITVTGLSVQAVQHAFEAEFLRRYGVARSGGDLEVVNARVRVEGPVGAAPPTPSWPASVPEHIVGPARIALAGTTLVVESGWACAREGPLLRLRRVDPRELEAALDEATETSLWGARFAAVAADSGEVLRRLARSVNIRERLDFSCAVFDGTGTLIANAPHVPVHLGAMGETVRDVLAAYPDAADGDSWLTNDPAAGGSHLPDLTVVRMVRLGDERFMVANRAHHVDVGGITPGSMPPASKSLKDEGVVFRRFPLVSNGEFHAPDLHAVRDPDTVVRDLRAQVAANEAAAQGLRALGNPALLEHRMVGLVEAVRRAVEGTLPTLHGEAEDEIGGVPLRLRVSGGTFDFTGSGGPHAGNLNAPVAVTRAAVLYALRVIVGKNLPLNEGVLRAVTLVLPPGSILDPPPGVAVVGGNVETSQRLVDLIFRAVGLRAASQGTMNNLSIGAETWAFYETIGGGLGATSLVPGRSGAQVHMTNTRATDPEVLEARLPLRLRRFAFRLGSGGRGARCGGDGLVRELEVLEACTVALLAAWRAEGAQGLGGEEGSPGKAFLTIDGCEVLWDGSPRRLAAGDRVRVETPGGGGAGN